MIHAGRRADKKKRGAGAQCSKEELLQIVLEDASIVRGAPPSKRQAEIDNPSEEGGAADSASRGALITNQSIRYVALSSINIMVKLS